MIAAYSNQDVYVVNMFINEILPFHWTANDKVNFN
jgi:hypothetical protein